MLLIYLCAISQIIKINSSKMPSNSKKNWNIDKKNLSTVNLESNKQHQLGASEQVKRQPIKRIISSDFLGYVDPNGDDDYYYNTDDESSGYDPYDKPKNFPINLKIPRKLESRILDNLDIYEERSKSTMYTTFSHLPVKKIDIFNSTEVLDISEENINTNHTESTPKLVEKKSNKDEITRTNEKYNDISIKKGKEEQTLQLKPGGPSTHFSINKYKDYFSYEDSEKVNDNKHSIVKVYLMTRLPDKLLEQKPTSYTVKVKTTPMFVENYGKYTKQTTGKKANEQNVNRTVYQEGDSPIVKMAVPEVIKSEAMFLEQREKDKILLNGNTTRIGKYDILKPLPKVTDY